MEDTLVYWAIATFDRTKEKPLPVETRFWVLDWDSVSPKEKQEILAILGADDERETERARLCNVGDVESTYGFSQPDLRMLKYRDRFRYRTGFDFGKAVAPNGQVARILQVNLGVDYFEDEQGNPVSEIDMFRHITGEENPVILGKSESVLRLGPAPLAPDRTPTVDDSDILARFLDVVGYVAGSAWYRTLPSLKVIKTGSERLTRAVFPEESETLQVVTLIRQLYASDDLLNIAANRYMKLCGDRRKVDWIKQTKTSFNAFLNGAVLFSPVSGTTTRELLDTFLYGGGIIHSKGVETPQRRLRQLIDDHGQAQIVMSVHASLRHLMGYATDVFVVVRQDFREWLKSGVVPKPKRLAIEKLLAGRMEEVNRGHQER
jgi:hypothetical protein